jgi:hypothetical protein
VRGQGGEGGVDRRGDGCGEQGEGQGPHAARVVEGGDGSLGQARGDPAVDHDVQGADAARQHDGHEQGRELQDGGPVHVPDVEAAEEPVPPAGQQDQQKDEADGCQDRLSQRPGVDAQARGEQEQTGDQ